jgi:hypothetical protein
MKSSSGVNPLERLRMSFGDTDTTICMIDSLGNVADLRKLSEVY